MTCQRLVISVAQLRIIVISVLLPPAAGNSSSLCFAAAAERPTIAESSGIEQQQQQHGALRRRSLLLLGLFAAGSPCAAAAKLSPGSPVATSEVSEVNDLALKAINAYRYCVGERGVGEGGREGGGRAMPLLQWMGGGREERGAGDGCSSPRPTADSPLRCTRGSPTAVCSTLTNHHGGIMDEGLLHPLESSVSVAPGVPRSAQPPLRHSP